MTAETHCESSEQDSNCSLLVATTLTTKFEIIKEILLDTIESSIPGERETNNQFPEIVISTTDEMGQPNSKNPPTSSSTKYRSASQSPTQPRSRLSSTSSNSNRGSSGGSTKSVRFDDTNLVTTITYAQTALEEVFYEANELNNCNSTAELDDQDNQQSNTVPLVQIETFDESDDEDDEDDLISAIEYISEDQITVVPPPQPPPNDENYANDEIAKNTESSSELEKTNSGSEQKEKIDEENEQNNDLEECECAFNDESFEFSDESEVTTTSSEETSENSSEIENLKQENLKNSIYTHSESGEAAEELQKKAAAFMEESISLLPDLVESSHQVVIGDQILIEDKLNGIDKIENM